MIFEVVKSDRIDTNRIVFKYGWWLDIMYCSLEFDVIKRANGVFMEFIRLKF